VALAAPTRQEGEIRATHGLLCAARPRRRPIPIPVGSVSISSISIASIIASISIVSIISIIDSIIIDCIIIVSIGEEDTTEVCVLASLVDACMLMGRRRSYSVARTSTGNLPVYIDTNTTRTFFHTVVRLVSGNVKQLVRDYQRQTNARGDIAFDVKTASVRLAGNHVGPLKQFLQAKGF
jgi:hypothetical protein